MFNKLHSIKASIGEWQPNYRIYRKEEVTLARLRIGHTFNMKIGTAYRRARRSLQCCPVTTHWYRIIIFSSFMSLMRGAVVEWLEQLGYGVDSRRIA